MIKLENLTPPVYYKESRDFQFLGRLFDIVLNYAKTAVGLIYKSSTGEKLQKQLIDLLATTLGFTPKRNYNLKQLIAVCSVFPLIMRNKGNITSILLACNAVLHAEGILDAPYIETSTDGTILLFIPPKLSDTSLLNDIFEYIIPAGKNIELVRSTYIYKNIVSNLKLAGSNVRPYLRTTASKDIITNKVAEDEYNYFKDEQIAGVYTYTDEKTGDKSFKPVSGIITNIAVVNNKKEDQNK